MNTLLVSTATIRQRGQLTIPDKIRALFSWASINAPVRIAATIDEKILIEEAVKPSVVDWKKLRKQLDRVSLYKGTRGNLSRFITEDRERH